VTGGRHEGMIDGMRRHAWWTMLAALVMAPALVAGSTAAAAHGAPAGAAPGAVSAGPPMGPRAAGPAVDSPVAGIGADPAGGYWLVTAAGGVYPYGAASSEGSAAGDALAAPVVGMASTAGGGGYWLVASDGGVFAYGAPFLGSMGGRRLDAPVVGGAADPVTGGYWLVAADGGVFAYGAPFLGSTGGRRLDAPVVGMASTADGGGYWLVASDGGVFAYGDARFAGSMGGRRLAEPVVGMAADPVTGGYWLVAADGGVFAYGAPFLGSTGGRSLPRAVAGVAASGGTGYWLAGADGTVYALGDAPDDGSLAVLPLAGLTVVLDPGHDGGNGSNTGIIDRPINGGGFTEPCDTVGTATDSGYPEHAFNWAVALAARAQLQGDGARVVLTRGSDTGVGPCVNVRAAIADELHAAAAVSIHADGGPPGGSGFSVDTPVGVVSSISDNRGIVGPSSQLGVDVRNAFESVAGEPTADYTGTAGIVPRSDLGGLNLSTVPKVLIECANMRNAHDAALTESPPWQQLAGQGIAAGVEDYLEAALRT